VHLSAFELLCVAGGLVIAVLATHQLPKLWRDPRRLLGMFSQRWVRAIPTGIVGCWLWLVFISLVLVAASASGTLADLFLGLSAVMAGVLIVWATLWLSVFVLGRPESLVPPTLRRSNGSEVENQH
jgi:hypothetical protein